MYIHTLLKKYIFLFHFLLGFHFLSAQLSPDLAIEQANKELWEKFIDKYGIINDFVGERPTPYDCLLSRPNAFGWWTPIEDGSFFTGLYLAAACERAKFTDSDIDKDKARILAQGLLKMASISDVPGFIARGVSTDGRTHFPIGSNDQTIPWFYGLYSYLKTDIPSAEERVIIEKKLVEVVDAVRRSDWKFPSAGMFTGDFRDNLLHDRFLEVPCYLFLLRATYELTGENSWLEWYKNALLEYPEGATKTRAEICATGIVYDRAMWGERRDYLWIYVVKQASLVELARMEEDASIKANFQKGIENNRAYVMEFVKQYSEFDNNDTKKFGNVNWRECYPTWYPQFTKEEAIELSRKRDSEKAGERKKYERNLMTNPLAAASIIALSGHSEDCELIDKVVSHYNYSKLYMGEFFFAEYAYYLRSCNK